MNAEWTERVFRHTSKDWWAGGHFKLLHGWECNKVDLEFLCLHPDMELPLAADPSVVGLVFMKRLTDLDTTCNRYCDIVSQPGFAAIDWTTEGAYTVDLDSVGNPAIIVNRASGTEVPVMLMLK